MVKKFDVSLEEFSDGMSICVSSSDDARHVMLPEFLEADGVSVLRAIEELKMNLDALMEWIEEEMREKEET